MGSVQSGWEGQMGLCHHHHHSPTNILCVCFCQDVCSFRAQQHMLFDQQASELVNSEQVGWEEGTI